MDTCEMQVFLYAARMLRGLNWISHSSVL
ncbi:hypothetical protein Goklo_001000 [Gossypium klotzschianum]|uniref:Uncharacterized protein n=1 Tax=Gossypium klotzschianum TaxID=34286 RepID=A0A7J8VYW7_9ROSI|nr:hypothetical protein [Gossypium klotzschianum]